ncbi:hypothetical protein GH733_011373, partial [Mirounga leonina]
MDLVVASIEKDGRETYCFLPPTPFGKADRSNPFGEYQPPASYATHAFSNVLWGELAMCLRVLPIPQPSPADIAQRYRISKYPTLKLFRNGMMMKREYRGQRSVKALADYIRQQKSDPVQELHDLAEITTLDRSKRNIIGYFEQKDSENYRVFERVANILHDDCAFLSAFGAVSKPERYSGDNIIYKPPGHSAPDMVYLGSMTNFDGTYNWIQDKCVPLVREITFENGEELTEEGLPFLILFHMKEDTESLEIFQNEVARQLISEKGTINFLHADCDKFRHPLLHIQKTPADCPVIAIDSFRHMYVFGDFRDVLNCRQVQRLQEKMNRDGTQYKKADYEKSSLHMAQHPTTKCSCNSCHFEACKEANRTPHHSSDECTCHRQSCQL